MRAREVAPYLVWCGAFVAFAGACTLLLPDVGAAYDFTREGRLSAHLTDRSLLPIVVTQNGAGNMSVLIALVATYWIAYAAYERIVALPSRRFAAGAFCVAVAAAVAVPIFPTTDPYAYALYAYESGPLGVDPYVAQTFGGPWGHALLGTFSNPSALVRACQYGPLFPMLYGAVAIVMHGSSLFAFLIAERCVGVVAVIVTALALALAEPAQPPNARVRRAVTYALHPLGIFECIAFAHGDAVLIAELALAYAAWRRGYLWPAGVFCGLAICTRFVGILGLVALVVATSRRSRFDGYAALSGAVVCVAVFVAMSEVRFHDVSFGGQAVNYGPYSAPLNAIAGLHLQEALGAVLIALLVYRGWRTDLAALRWLPIALLAGLPTLYANYFAWIVPVRALSGDPRIASVTRAMSLVAPLTYVVHLDPFPAPGASAAVQCVVLAAVWIPVLFAFRASAQEITTSN